MTDLPASVRWQLWIVAFGFFMQSLDTTIVNTALPSMAKSLGESPLHMHMIIVSYVLTVAVMLPASGWLADRVGIRRVHLSCAVVFSLSLLALPLMLGSRIQLMAICLLLGAAAGALFTLSPGRAGETLHWPEVVFD